jgi:hypothetical protein
VGSGAGARKMLGWSKTCRLAYALLWEYSYKRLKLAQLLGQLGVFLARSKTKQTNHCVLHRGCGS